MTFFDELVSIDSPYNAVIKGCFGVFLHTLGVIPMSNVTFFDDLASVDSPYNKMVF